VDALQERGLLDYQVLVSLHGSSASTKRRRYPIGSLPALGNC
jgi:hypothetical protein